jgi:cytoskeleton protein RodZ
MSEQRTDNEAKSPEARIAFGQTLQLAREQAGLSLEYAAEQLNLPEKTVTAIENSDMSKLPPAAFVRGYIRVYAKILEIDEVKLLKDFDALVPHAHEAELHPLSSLPLEANSGMPLIRVVTAMVAVIGVLVLIYGAIKYYTQKSEDMEQVADNGNGQLQLPPEAPFGIERDASHGITELTAVGDVEATEPYDEPSTAVAATDAEMQTMATIIPPPSTAVRSETSEEQSLAAEPAVEPAVARDVLVLESSADSWAEIQDATGERKFYGLLNKGRARTLNGVAPFDIFLGNAPAVRLTLNEDSVDMTKHTRSNNIAHFKVTTINGRARIQ